jgi:hypothetical protein
MGKAKSITVVVAVLAVLSAAGYWFVTWNVRRSLDKTDWQGLTDLIKAPLGETVTKPAVVEERPQTTQQPASAKAVGWANASPSEIKSAARQADTYLAAVEVGNVALGLLKERAALPSTSAELQGVSPRRRLDGWGHPFCLAEVSGRVAVMSAGPSATAISGCSEVGISPRDLANLPADKLYRYPSGALLFLAARK